MNQTVPTPSFCPKCNFQILDTYNFCPNCGRKFKNLPQSLSVTRQTYVYFISLFLPPLGVVPAIKYLLDKRPRAKIIGVVAIVLTIISIYLTFKIASDFLNSQRDIANQQLNALEQGIQY